MMRSTFRCELTASRGNLGSGCPITTGRQRLVRGHFFVLRSLSARVGMNEIPRRFSSLPLFFASGRFATFFFWPDATPTAGACA